VQLSRRREAFLLAACVASYLGLAGMRAWQHTYPHYDDVAFSTWPTRRGKWAGRWG